MAYVVGAERMLPQEVEAVVECGDRAVRRQSDDNLAHPSGSVQLLAHSTDCKREWRTAGGQPNV